jgi:hypothetical protein
LGDIETSFADETLREPAIVRGPSGTEGEERVVEVEELDVADIGSSESLSRFLVGVSCGNGRSPMDASS